MTIKTTFPPKDTRSALYSFIGRAAEWCVSVLGLIRWNIHIHVSDRLPKILTKTYPRKIKSNQHRCGGFEAFPRVRRARIWLSPNASTRCGEPIVRTLFHELSHIYCRECGLGPKADTRPEELLCDALANLLYSNWTTKDARHEDRPHSSTELSPSERPSPEVDDQPKRPEHVDVLRMSPRRPRHPQLPRVPLPPDYIYEGDAP